MGNRGSKPREDRRTEIEKIQDEIEAEKKMVEQQEWEWNEEKKKLDHLYELLTAARNRAGMNKDGVSYQSIINNLNARIAFCEWRVQMTEGILNMTRGVLNQKIEQLSQLQKSYDDLGVEKQKADLKISDLNFEIQGPKGYVSQVNELNRRIYDPTGYIAEVKKSEEKISQLDISVNVLNQEAIFLTQLDYVDMDGPLLMTQLNGVGLNYSFNNQHGMIEPLMHPGLGVAFRMPFDK
jgi:chromosome segregation ATPase